MKIKYYIIFIIVVIVFITLISNVEEKNIELQNSEISTELNQEEYDKILASLADILENQNPRIALENLKEESKQNNNIARSCHSLVHDLGHLAYQKYKDFGISMRYQDEMCNSGYLHGVIESHFSKSEDLFSSTEEVCSSYPYGKFISWECYHGVGHGIMYFLENDLEKSIQICERYIQDFERDSCINGVYMEDFNVDQKIHISKFLNSEDPFFPCREQKEEYKADCYLYSPVYYLSLNENSYEKALAWCKNAENKYQETCVRGVGSQAIKENINNPKLVEKICLTGESYQIEPCIEGMINLYINHYGSLREAKELCPKLRPRNIGFCKNAIVSMAYLF